MSFGFRLRFRIPEAQRLSCSEQIFDHIFFLDRDCFLCPSLNLSRVSANGGDKRLDEVSDLSITASGYLTLEEASHAGSRMLAALRLAQLLLGTGVDAGPSTEIGTGRPQFQTSQAELNRNASLMGLGADSFIDDRLGVTIFRGSKPQFSPLRLGVTRVTNNPLPKLVDALVHANSVVGNQGDKFALVCELYNSNHFEASTRARFLTLMTSVEVLAYGEQVSERSAVKFKKGKALINRVVPVSFCGEYHGCWERCYKARNDLVHEGRTELRLGSLLVGLDRLVRALTVYCFNAGKDYLYWDR
jgi:hypothetical protein